MALPNKFEIKIRQDDDSFVCEITNGSICLCISDDGEEEDMQAIVDALNKPNVKWYSNNKLELDQHIEIMQLQDRVRRLADAFELIANAPVPANEREYISWFVTAKNIAGGALSELAAEKEIASWNEWKESAKEAVLRTVTAIAEDVSKDAESAEAYLKSEGVDLERVKADAAYFAWKSRLMAIAKQHTGHTAIIDDEEAKRWYNDGYTPEQCFRETWQSDGD